LDPRYHVAFTIQYNNGSPQKANVYVDYYDASGAVENGDLPTMNWASGRIRRDLTNVSIILGRYKNNDNTAPTGQWFVGRMDEVRIWQGVRDPTDVYPGYTNRTLDWTMPQSALAGTGLAWSGQLIASYDHNEGSGKVLTDKSGNKFDGHIIGPANWAYSDIQIMSYEYTRQVFPTVIDLVGLNTLEPVGSPQAVLDTFQVNFTSQLQGTLYEYAGPNGIVIGGIQYPELGDPIDSGDVITATKVVYVSNSVLADTTTRFFYAAISANGTSRYTEVRMVVDCCCSPGDVIDYCGVCNGGNKTIDSCGVCSTYQILLEVQS
jgi:hypothetical protein